MGLENIDFALYLNIAFFSALGIGLLIGLLKGFRRSLYTFIITIIFIGIFFLTVNTVVTSIYGMNLGFLGGLLANVSSDLNQATSFQEAIRMFVFGLLGDSLDTSQTNPEFLEFVDAIGVFILKIAYTILYFTVIQFLYRFILFIISFFIFRKGRSKNKKGKRGRLLGGVFGTLTAAVNVFVLIIMLSGIMSISESLVTLQPDNLSYEINLDKSTKPNLVDLNQSLEKVGRLNPKQMAETNSQIDEAFDTLDTLIAEYNSNLVIQAINSYQIEDDITGENKNAAIILFDEVLSIQYKTTTIALREDFKTFSEIAGIYLNSDFYDTNNLTDLSSQEINQMFTTLSESKLLTTIIPIGIEVGIDYMDVDIDLEKDMLYEDINWSEELAQIGVVASTAFLILENANLLEENIDYKTVSLSGSDVEQLFTELSNSKLVEYGAYIAVEPLLKSAGETVESVITVPEDIDWQDEFRAFGMIANEILSTGLTIADLEGDDQQELLLLFTNVDLTVLLESQLTTNALINILSGESNIEFGIDFLVIPDMDRDEWFDSFDDLSGDRIDGELRRILTSLNIMVQYIDQIDIDNLEIQNLANISDDDIDDMFESEILVASISQLITNLPTGDFNLVIPDRVLDENDYIIKEEVKNIFKSITMAAREIPCDEGNTACEDIGFDMNKVTQLSSDNIDTLFNSDILYATTAALLMGFEDIVVPKDVQEDLMVDGSPMSLVTKTEIKSAFTAITALGISDFENLSISGDLLLNLSVDPVTQPTTLDTSKTDKIFASKILHATISYFLIKETEVTPPETSPLVVPYFATEFYEGTTTDVVKFYDTVGEVDYISSEELTNIIAAVLVLDISDFSTFDTIDINTIISNSPVLLASAILHATISEQILNLDGDMLIVPTMSEDNEALLIVTGDVVAEQTTYIKKSELIATLDALELLEITDFENPNIDISVLNKLAKDTDPTELNTDNTQALFASKILHATISDFIIKEADGSDTANLILPYYASVDYDGTTTNIVRIKNNADEVYISINELEAIISAFLKLEIDDFTEVDSLELTTIFEHSTILLSSAILHATISDQIIELGKGDNLIVPEYDLDDNSLYITTGVIPEEQTTYITITEINNTLLALEVLEITDFNNVSIDATIINKLSVDEVTNPTELDSSKMSTLLGSKIVHATISKVIRDAAEPDATTGESNIIIPTYASENYSYGSDEVSVTTIGSDIYIVEDELSNLLQAYLLLEIDDFSEVDSLDLTLIADNIEDLLESAILHATITKLILDAAEEDPITGESDIVVPFFATENYAATSSNVVRETIKDTDTYISKLELFELFEALMLLDIDDFTAVDTLTLADINLHKDDLLESSILHATVSKQVIELGDSETLEFPELYFTDETYATEAALKEITGDVLDETDTTFIIKAELINTLEALDILEIQDFNTVTIDASILKKLSIDEVTHPTEISETKTNTLLSSKIVHATISKVIKDAAEPDAITGESDILVPTYASENYNNGSDEVIRTTSELDEYIVEDELIELFGAYLLLDINDFSEVDGLDLTVIASNRVEMLKSAILHATISNIIIKEGEPDAITGESNIIVPFFATENYGTTSSNVVRETIKSTDIYISKLELYELFEALELLGIDDFTAVDTLTIAQINEHKEALLDSSILHATVSNQVIDLGDSENLVLPSLYFTDENYDTEESIKVTSGDALDNTETTFVIKAELINTLEALDILEIQDFNTVTIDASILKKLSVNEVTNPTEISETKTNTLLSSKIVHATISKVIKDAAEPDALTGDSDISIPTYASENYDNGNDEVSKTTADSDQYIVEDELIKLFGAYLLLEINDFSEVETLNLTIFSANITTIVESAILHATISKQILDAAEIDAITGESDILVPYEATENYAGTVSNLTRETIKSTDEYITKLELFELFEALEVLGINNFNDVETALTLTNMIDNKDDLMDSAILHATMSDSIIKENTAGTITVPYEATENYAGTASKLVRISITSTLPDSSTHTDIYISKNEFNEMFEALTALGITDFNDVETALSLTNMIANKDALLESAILHATMSDSIIDENTAGTIIVPYEATEDYTGTTSKLVRISIDTTLDDSSVHTDTYIVKSEFNELFEALTALGITDFNDVETALSLTNMITNKTALLESAILHATMSDSIIDENTAGTIIVPYEATVDYTGTTSKLVRISIDTTLDDSSVHTDTYIVKNEIDELFEALTALGITDFNDVETALSLTNMIANKTALLESAILHATMSDSIIDENTAGTIIVPYEATVDYTGTTSKLVRISIDTTLDDSSVHTDNYIAKDEFDELFEALTVLGITDFNDVETALSLTNMITNKTALLESAILHATISDIIIEESTPDVITNESNLILPKEAIENYTGTTTKLVKENIITTFDDLSTHTDNYVSINELNELFEALDALGVSDFNNVTTALSISNMLTNIDTLLESAILHATISEQILDLDTDNKVNVPNKDIDEVVIKYSQLDTTSYDAYIIKNEIKNLIEGLNLLGATDISGFDGNLDISGLSLGTDQDKVLSSAILHSTFSNKLITLDDEILIVPEYSQEGETAVNLIKKTVDSTEFIVKNEVKAIISAFIIMDVGSINNVTSFELDKFFDNPNTLLSSSSIQATVSYKLLNGTGGALIIPDKDINDDPDKVIRIIQTDVTYIELVELKALLAGLDSLGLTSFTAMTFTPANIFAADFTIVLASASLQATISETVLDGAVDENNITSSSDLIVPTYFRETITVNTANATQIEKTELHNLLTGLEELGVTSFTGGVSPTVVTGLSSTKLNTILNSGSLHVTIDNMLQANAGLTIPTFVLVDLYNIVGLIEKTEIVNFIAAVNALGQTDITNATISFSTITSLTPTEQSTVLDSAIVRATITPDVETAKQTAELLDPYTGTWEYETDGTTLTKASIQGVINQYY